MERTDGMIVYVRKVSAVSDSDQRCLSERNPRPFIRHPQPILTVNTTSVTIPLHSSLHSYISSDNNVSSVIKLKYYQAFS